MTAKGKKKYIGGRVVNDPTLNVRELTAAEARRQDDLRNASEAGLRREMQLRSEFDKEYRRLEASRVDEIHASDQRTIAEGGVAAEARANALANTLATTAEQSRSQVAATAAAANIALKAETDPLRKDLAEIRQFQWGSEGGKRTTGDARLWITLGVSVLVGLSGSLIGLAGLAVAVYVARP